jgi:adenosylcobinamide kinase/adenosylcobinamide-phosphate guanylyltransferase
VKVLVTGGARSGKSRFALGLAGSLAPPRFYLATAEALDEEMALRIATHRKERGPDWHTIEEPIAIASLLSQPGPVVVDCLTLWVSNLLTRECSDAELTRAIRGFSEAFAVADNPVIAVTNEVGLGIVPDNALARRFRDAAGSLAQQVAGVADRVVLMCAGLPIEVKTG